MIRKRNIHRDTITKEIGEWLVYDLKPGAANAFALAVQNPYNDKNLIITEVIVRITTTGGTATSVLDIGVVANATATADTIFDGIDLNAAGLLSSRTAADTGTNGDEKLKLWEKAGGTNDYLTGKILVEKCDNLVGKVYVRVVEAQ